MKKAALVLLIVLLVIIAVLGYAFTRRQARNRVSEGLTACISNCKNIGTALEMYASDHGAYPVSLNLLTPEYLKRLPTCPAAGVVTYESVTYLPPTSSPTPGGLLLKKLPQVGMSYTVCCQGESHKEAGVPANYPQYNNLRGLLLPH